MGNKNVRHGASSFGEERWGDIWLGQNRVETVTVERTLRTEHREKGSQFPNGVITGRW